MSQTTFRISCDDHVLTSSDVADLLYNYSYEIEGGFLHSYMAYMSNYDKIYKFRSRQELREAINKYCAENDITTFNCSTLQINFVIEDRLLYFEINVNKTDMFDGRLSEALKRQIRPGSSKEAQVYKKLFKEKEADEIKTVEPAQTFLPPWYNSTGDHVGGGVPGVKYPNYKKYPTAYTTN